MVVVTYNVLPPVLIIRKFLIFFGSIYKKMSQLLRCNYCLRLFYLLFNVYLYNISKCI